MFKYVLMANILLILISLAFGAFFLAKGEKNSKKLLTSLSLRVGLSITLIILVIIGFANGWIAPHQL
ncbi:MAG: DUF2909 domain-containing protein [Thiotrichaceae bacterium]|nr:DUF2909 domain-containing protein [Thiotrichaceae bacterium]